MDSPVAENNLAVVVEVAGTLVVGAANSRAVGVVGSLTMLFVVVDSRLAGAAVADMVDFRLEQRTESAAPFAAESGAFWHFWQPSTSLCLNLWKEFGMFAWKNLKAAKHTKTNSL